MINSQTHNAQVGLLEGTLGAWKEFPDGTREQIFYEDNLIVKAAKLYLLSSLWDGDVIADPVSTFRVGTGGAIDPEGMFPKPEDPLATGLVTPLLSVPTSFVVYADEVKVTYLADINQDTGNGYKITEAGLFKESGLIFNVKNFPAIPKTSEFSLHFEWSVRAI